MIEFAPRLFQHAGEKGPRRGRIARVMQAALEAVDPFDAVLATLRRDGDQLWVNNAHYDLTQYEHVYVVGAGKAGAPMARAVEQVLGDRVSAGYVNVKYGHTLPTERVTLHEAGHPLPDAEGVRGAREIARMLERAGAHDLVICLISGGGSALMTLPVEGVSLADMHALTDALLRVGATIDEINTVRKHLEQAKGGRVAALAHPAPIISLILSDVVGNPLDVISSGPTVPDTTTFCDARRLLERYGLWDEIPPSVRGHLLRGCGGEVAETPKAGDAIFCRAQNAIVASNDLGARAAERAAAALGMHTLVLSTFVEGEAREVAKVYAAVAREVLASGRPIPRPACIIAGGETTVTLRGRGRGGRNQEMALAAAISIAGLSDVSIACLATDGTDGPTDASGALAEGDTLERAAALGLDPWEHLAANDSYPFFDALGDLLLTGPTNTNVNDLAFVFVW